MTGKFITFEGIDGSGKTTQINLLEQKLIQENIPYVIFREPGGTILSEKIREILLDRKNIELSSVAESLLFVAARAQLFAEKINPALERNKFVICDRFADSTVAYQGYGRGLNVEYLEELNKFATNNIYPDFTIVLDVDPVKAAQRLQDTTFDRMESTGNNFFHKVQEGYYSIARHQSHRCVIIDSNRTPENVFEDVYEEINEKILKEMKCT